MDPYARYGSIRVGSGEALSPGPVGTNLNLSKIRKGLPNISEKIRQNPGIPEPLRMGPYASGGCARVDSGPYGWVRVHADPQMGFPSQNSFSQIPDFPGRFSQPSPRWSPNPKVSVVGRVYHFQLTDTKETWPRGSHLAPVWATHGIPCGPHV